MEERRLPLLLFLLVALHIARCAVRGSARGAASLSGSSLSPATWIPEWTHLRTRVGFANVLGWRYE